MTGDGEGHAVEPKPRGRRAGEFDVPAVLAQLDAADESTRLKGVMAVDQILDEEPARAVPTVPKLRSLLEDESTYRGLAAACLADLAVESPDDVAPSAGTIAAFARAQARSDRAPAAAADALRCLATVADERPEAVVEHLDDVAVALDSDDRSAAWGRATLEAVAAAYPDRVDAVAPFRLERS